MLYEDDALRVVQALTGQDAPEADRFRKRVSKHRTEDEAAALAGEFHTACANHGVPEEVAAEVWGHLARFRQYTFCKSHAVSYGLIAWTAAYLKAHEPLTFWMAALNNNQGMYPRRVYVEAVKRAGIPVLLPCVNHSEGPFTGEEGAIRAGLDAIANLDEEFRQGLLGERRHNGPFGDLADFRRRVRPGPEALAVLIRCGALDFTGQSRPALFLEAELQDREDVENRGSSFLEPRSRAGWSPPDYAAERRLRDEWQILGFAAGAPLLSLLGPRLPPDRVTSGRLEDHVGRKVLVAGLVATARHTLTVDGRPMQFITLEDEEGLMEVTLFPGGCPPVASLTLGPYLVTGMVEDQFDVLTVTAQSIQQATGP
jgi:DNA polymerase III alpha subunit